MACSSWIRIDGIDPFTCSSPNPKPRVAHAFLFPPEFLLINPRASFEELVLGRLLTDYRFLESQLQAGAPRLSRPWAWLHGLFRESLGGGAFVVGFPWFPCLIFPPTSQSSIEACLGELRCRAFRLKCLQCSLPISSTRLICCRLCCDGCVLESLFEATSGPESTSARSSVLKLGTRRPIM